MLLKELLLNKQEIIRIVKKNKDIDVKVFGSTVNGSSTKNSDVDILVKCDILPPLQKLGFLVRAAKWLQHKRAIPVCPTVVYYY